MFAGFGNPRHAVLDSAHDRRRFMIDADGAAMASRPVSGPAALAGVLQQAEALVAAQRLTEARLVLESACTAHPDNGPLAARLADVLGRFGEHAAAAAVLGRAWPVLEAHPVHHLALAHRWRDAGRHDTAIATLQAACERFPDDLMLRMALAGLLADIGRAAEALDHFEAAAHHPEAPLYVHQRLVDLLDSLGRPEEALEAVRAGKRAHADAPLLDRAAVRQLELLERFDEAADLLERLVEEDPESFVLHHWLASLAHRCGRMERAEQALERCLAIRPDSPVVVQSLMDVQWADGRFGDAGVTAMEACDRGLLTRDTAIDMARRLATKGLDNHARSLVAADMSHRRSRLPADLVSGLADLRQRSPDAAFVPTARLDWAWRLSGQVLDFGTWRERALWGFEANRLLRDWLESGADGNAIAELATTLPDFSPLRARHQEGRGVLVVAAHTGIPAVVFEVLLRKSGVPLLTVTNRPNLGYPYGHVTISPAPNFDPSGVARRIVRTLNGGGVVALAADGQQGKQRTSHELGGRTFSMSAFVPRLMQRHRVPVFWAEATWHDEGVGLALSESVAPAEGESPERWIARWNGWYFDRVKAVVDKGPENAGLAGGFWQQIEAAA